MSAVQCLPIPGATGWIQLISIWWHEQCGAEQCWVRERDCYVLLQWAYVCSRCQPRLLQQLGFPQGERKCEVVCPPLRCKIGWGGLFCFVLQDDGQQKGPTV
jgi:hypothetical protein